MTLLGVNLSPDLTRYAVRARGDDVVAPAAAIGVRFPLDVDPTDGIESRLDVALPTDSAVRFVEVFVSGRAVGTACLETAP